MGPGDADRFQVCVRVSRSVQLPISSGHFALQSLFTKYNALWTAIVTWVGKPLLGMNITVLPNGSGDTTYDYVQILCMLAMAATATVIWSLLDRRAQQLRKASPVVKALRSNRAGYCADHATGHKGDSEPNAAPTLSTLTETYGQSSPMHLLWTFMGASRGYNAFAGGASRCWVESCFSFRLAPR